MRAGRLDRLIDIQRKTSTQSGSGEPTENWTNLCARRPASYRALKADEKIQQPETIAFDQVEFRTRFSSVISDLSPLDRVIYPALNEGDNVPKDRIYDILAVAEIGRREGLLITAQRRPDVGA